VMTTTFLKGLSARFVVQRFKFTLILLLTGLVYVLNVDGGLIGYEA